MARHAADITQPSAPWPRAAIGGTLIVVPHENHSRLHCLCRHVAGLATSAASAHHSWSAEYDVGRSTSISGTLARVMLRNPHSALVLNVTDRQRTSRALDRRLGQPAASARARYYCCDAPRRRTTVRHRQPAPRRQGQVTARVVGARQTTVRSSAAIHPRPLGSPAGTAHRIGCPRGRARRRSSRCAPPRPAAHRRCRRRTSARACGYLRCSTTG